MNWTGGDERSRAERSFCRGRSANVRQPEQGILDISAPWKTEENAYGGVREHSAVQQLHHQRGGALFDGAEAASLAYQSPTATGSTTRNVSQ